MRIGILALAGLLLVGVFVAEGAAPAVLPHVTGNAAASCIYMEDGCARNPFCEPPLSKYFVCPA